MLRSALTVRQFDANSHTTSTLVIRMELHIHMSHGAKMSKVWCYRSVQLPVDDASMGHYNWRMTHVLRNCRCGKYENVLRIDLIDVALNFGFGEIEKIDAKNGRTSYCCMLSRFESWFPYSDRRWCRQSASRRPWHENSNRLLLNDTEFDDDVAEKYDTFDVDVDFQCSRRRESHGGGGDLCLFVSHTENALGKWSAFKWESIAVVIVRCHCGIFVENSEIEYSRVRENELSRRARRPCQRRTLTITIFLSICILLLLHF